jgi:hypothetical protein
MVATTALMLNQRYSGRYGTRARYSAQGTGCREFTVLETAHSAHTHEQGPIIRVLDHGDNIEKTWYVSRLFDVDGLSDDEDEAPVEGTLAEGVPVRINRADSLDGSVLGRVVSDDGFHTTVKTVPGNSTQTFLRTRLIELTERQLKFQFRRDKRRRSRRLDNRNALI